jgi:hypothetical protein
MQTTSMLNCVMMLVLVTSQLQPVINPLPISRFDMFVRVGTWIIMSSIVCSGQIENHNTFTILAIIKLFSINTDFSQN